MNTPNSDNSWQDCPEGEIGDLVGQLNRKDRNQKILRIASGSTVGLCLFLGVAFFLNSSNRIQNPNDPSEPNFGGITCSSVLESLVAYQSGSLNRDTSSQIDKHLKSCPHCRKVYEEAESAKTAALIRQRTIVLSHVSSAFQLPGLLFRVAL